jgi:heparanase 1
VFTLNAGPASRRSDGSWNEENAAELMTYAMQHQQPVAVWELGNELNIFWAVHGFGSDVSVDQYCQDVRRARELVDRCSPAAKLAGQGSAFCPVLGEPLSFFFGFMPSYLQQTGDVLDVVSWHYYPQQSRRGPAASRRACPSRLLDPRNLDEAAYWAEKMRMWRERWASGKPLWLGETGNAQAGGEPGVSDAYIGGLWWLDQLGLLARLGHDVVVRQTLCGMNYGLIDDKGLEPRPDYWNSLLWKRLMGTQVYKAQAVGAHGGKLRVYAQATPGAKDGAVTVLAINLDHQRSATLSFTGLEGRRCELYQVTSPDVLGKTVLLNGTELKLRDDGHLPDISGVEQGGAGIPTVDIHPLAYTFAVFSPR